MVMRSQYVILEQCHTTVSFYGTFMNQTLGLLKWVGFLLTFWMPSSSCTDVSKSRGATSPSTRFTRSSTYRQGMRERMWEERYYKMQKKGPTQYTIRTITHTPQFCKCHDGPNMRIKPLLNNKHETVVLNDKSYKRSPYMLLDHWPWG